MFAVNNAPACLPTPLQVAALASKHGDKFRSGGVQAPPDDPLFTEPGLHPGSPSTQRTGAASWQAAEVQQVAGDSGSGGADAVATRQVGGGGSGASGAAAAADDGTDFVFGEVRLGLGQFSFVFVFRGNSKGVCGGGAWEAASPWREAYPGFAPPCCCCCPLCPAVPRCVTSLSSSLAPPAAGCRMPGFCKRGDGCGMR